MLFFHLLLVPLATAAAAAKAGNVASRFLQSHLRFSSNDFNGSASLLLDFFQFEGDSGSLR